MLIVPAVLSVNARRARSFKPEALSPALPFGPNVYAVFEGGNEGYGFFSSRPETYSIFNRDVLSPWDGQVAAVVDEWPNVVPWGGNGPYNLGNYVLIKHEEHYLLAVHSWRSRNSAARRSFIRAILCED
ncbi:MAG TPA: hypothetical protein VMW87_12250 [Spirochaetia bacterium]|nr:hypothetical protein [Spirochaetia bacterium]